MASDLPAETPSNKLVTGPLRSTLFWLAMPVFGEQVLNFLVGFYDVYLSGHLPADIRTAATAAVGVSAYVGWLASMVFALVATGTTALISRAWGSGDRHQANLVANRSVVLGVLTGGLFLLCVIPAAGRLVEAMGLEGYAGEIAIRYIRLDAIGLLFASVSFVIAAALRGCGDTRTPMLIFSGVNVVNVVVSTVLVYGYGPIPALGVDGIVGGTIAARVSGGLVFLVCMARGLDGITLNRSELILRGDTVRRILRIGLPAAADGVVMWIGHCLFLNVISRLGEASYGEAAFAAHIIGVRVEAISYLPAVAWGAAAATMVGQAIGAGERDRAVRAGHEAALQCGLFGIAITLWFTLGAGWIYRMMHQDELVRQIGTDPFRVVGLFQIPMMLAIVYFAALRGAGDTKFPLYATMFTTYVLRIPVGYFFGVTMQMGLMGAWMGMNCDMLARGLLALWRFSSRTWLDIEV